MLSLHYKHFSPVIIGGSLWKIDLASILSRKNYFGILKIACNWVVASQGQKVTKIDFFSVFLANISFSIGFTLFVLIINIVEN